MKRVCTLRKVLRSFFKGPLRKVILSFLYIVWLFMTTKFLLIFVLSPAGRYAMEWKGNPKYLHENFFSRFYCHICHTHINSLVYNGLMVTVASISIVTLLPPIATP